MKKQLKHIVIITPGFAVNEKDDYTISALQIYCKKLQEREDIKLSIISLHYPFSKKKYCWHNSIVYPLGFNNSKNWLFFLNRKVVKQLKTINKKTAIDCIHSFWLGECAYWGFIFSKRHKIKHITTLMGQDAKKGNVFAKILPLKKMNLITLSKFHQELVFKNYKISTTLIPWGIDKNSIPTKTKKTIDVIGVGSLIKLKRYQYFIETIAFVKKDFPKIKAVLVGSGKQEKALKHLSKKLNVLQNIIFTGGLDYKTTQKKIAKSKILLHPSNYESFGMIFAESLANNTKIISKKTGFAKESDFWKIADKPKDFAKLIGFFLQNKFSESTAYPLIENTLKGYLKLYKNENNN